MSDDGELPESEGELVDSDDGDGPSVLDSKENDVYTMFNKSTFNQVYILLLVYSRP